MLPVLEAQELRNRVNERIREWNVLAERELETESSIILFGTSDRGPVVLKVLRHRGDEGRSGEILTTFDGRGVVRMYEQVEGAILLQRLSPGDSLAGMSLSGDDEQATEILAGVIDKMVSHSSTSAVPSVQDWGKGFDRYCGSDDAQIPRSLVDEARRLYFRLCASQSRPRLLHGDLHHYNVLFDSECGWLAIDPKGVVGEVEYEIGAALRNPYERPGLFTDQRTIQKRVNRFALMLNLDAARILEWCFAQAVLSAIWLVEDGFKLQPDNSAILLSEAVGAMLKD